MSYVLNQYNQPVVDKSPASSPENQIYMTQLTGGTPKRRPSNVDSGVTGSSNDLFYDECVELTSPLLTNVNYYFHCRIKRLEDPQVFFIYLLNTNASPEENPPTQYLKTITVRGGEQNEHTEWVDFELVFSPLLSFNCILFQLQRTIKDYTDYADQGGRHPYICYEELSRINNIVTSKTGARAGLFKIGIQSRPGLMMCLNKEEIHIGRSGIYEVNNGKIVVDFLSIICAATEDPIIVPGEGTMTMEEYLDYIGNQEVVIDKDHTNSTCIFDNSKERKIDAFTLDYMYEETEE